MPVDAAEMQPETEALPFALRGPPLRGALKVAPEDFVVSEVLGFEPSGEGEHALLHVEKRGWNTDQLTVALARFAGVKPSAVGYAGLKDRHAVTRQHFTVHLPGRGIPDWKALALDGVRVLRAERHHRKLRRGALRGNEFRIRVRDVAGDTERAQEALRQAHDRGVPNYFGAQRFGRAGDNIRQAERLFRGDLGRLPRHKRSIYLSAARSWLFNRVLARRVTDGSWCRGLDGEIYRLAGSRAIFGPESRSETLVRRLAELDIHPTGPLWGRGELPTVADCRELEMTELDPYPLFREGLESVGMKQERRALRLAVTGLDWRFEGADLALEFGLEPGAYATVVLRELVAPAGR